MSSNNTATAVVQKRDGWGSRIGYILSTLGMSIGVGAVWRFPMLTAQYGGGAFVLAFVLISIIIVIPAGWGESALGRKYKKSVVGTLTEAAGKKGTVFGYLTAFVPTGLLAYYPVVMAVACVYAFNSLTGAPFLNDVVGFYDSVNSNRPLLYCLVVALIVVTALVNLRGVQKGVEKVCKIMLPVMFVLILVVVIRVVTLDGISAGLNYFLEPDWSQLASGELWMAAAGMALFAVGLGPGYLLTYGSYMSDKADLATDFVTVNATQLLLCLMCGFAIIPPVVLFGLDPTAGKGVLFQSLPMVFSQVPGGMIWFFLFMIALLFAGLSTTISMMEIPVSSLIDGLKISRPKATWIVVLVTCLIAIPCTWSDSFFALFDNIIGNVGYNVTAAGLALFLAWFVGAKKIRTEWYNPTSVIKYGSWVDILYKFLAVPAFLYFAITSILSLF